MPPRSIDHASGLLILHLRRFHAARPIDHPTIKAKCAQIFGEPVSIIQLLARPLVSLDAPPRFAWKLNLEHNNPLALALPMPIWYHRHASIVKGLR